MHAGVREQRVLNLTRTDPMTTGLDEIRRTPADDAQRPVVDAAMSPVRSQPSSVITAAVASGRP